jgi:pyridinium-3,5-biscarboxylic acid mononucleotide synthase
MNQDALATLLTAVKAGEVTVDAALYRLRMLPFADLGFAKVDLHRHVRQGCPEVVFSQGKTAEQVVAIIRTLREHNQAILATRTSPETAETVLLAFPDLKYYPDARIVGPAGLDDPERGEGRVLVISAGTSDQPVATEALLTARGCGSRAEAIFDAGVAGLHRLLAHSDQLQQARAIVVVAGMEGALPSVVGGLVACPVVAVPTSVGYGASFQGLAALLGMLNSCASNVSVVNIDNGFGAGFVASRINRLSPLEEQHA